jgi:hypothetical protein
MDRVRTLTVFAIAGMSVAAVSGGAVSNDLALEHSVVGIWKLLSLYEEDESGQDVVSFGRNCQGRLILDAAGQFSLQIGGDVFATAFRRDPTNAAAALVSARAPMLAYLGKYSVDHGRNIHFHVEHGLAPLEPAAVVTLIGDQMELTSSEQPPTGSNYKSSGLAASKVGS